MSCRKHEPCEIESLPVIGSVAGNKPAIMLAVWSVTRVYGGPEEGGWWYDAGDLEHLEVHSSMEIAKTRIKELRELYPNTGKRGSVLGGEDYEVELRDDGRIPHTYFPLVTPHYE